MGELRFDVDWRLASDDGGGVGTSERGLSAVLVLFGVGRSRGIVSLGRRKVSVKFGPVARPAKC